MVQQRLKVLHCECVPMFYIAQSSRHSSLGRAWQLWVAQVDTEDLYVNDLRASTVVDKD